MTEQLLRVELQLSAREPPAGWLQVDGSVRRRFGGWLELLGLLQDVVGADETQVMIQPSPTTTQARRRTQ